MKWDQQKSSANCNNCKIRCPGYHTFHSSLPSPPWIPPRKLTHHIITIDRVCTSIRRRGEWLIRIPTSTEWPGILMDVATHRVTLFLRSDSSRPSNRCVIGIASPSGGLSWHDWQKIFCQRVLLLLQFVGTFHVVIQLFFGRTFCVGPATFHTTSISVGSRDFN